MERPLGQRCVGVVAGLICAGLLGWAAPGLAQTTAPAPQVLTLNQDRLYAESLYGKALEARVAAASAALAAENRRIEQELAAEEADLTQKRPTMSAAAFQTLADAFDVKVERARTNQSAKIEALKAQGDAGRKAFFQAAVPVLADLMQQMGAYAILNQTSVVLAFDAIDVTNRAIQALDAKLGDGSGGATGPRKTGPDLPAAGGLAVGAPDPTPPKPTPTP